MSNPTWPVSGLKYVPDYGADLTQKPRVASSKFGDSYEQRSAVGLNNNPQIWSLQFNDRDTADVQTLDAFLKALGGVDYFYWTPPDATDPIKVIVRTWKITKAKPGRQNLAFQVEQVFDL